MGFESPKTAPEALLKYEAFWKETYGRNISPEEQLQLVGFAQELAKTDPTFKTILSESLLAEFLDADDGFGQEKARKFALIAALSSYGKRFGLQVD